MVYDSDVIVIGAGPAGSVSARSIAEAGYDVLLLEKDSFAGELSACGGVTPLYVARMFGIPDSVIEKKIHKIYYYFHDRVLAADFSYASFRRCVFDRYLAQQAVEKGAEMMCNTLAVGAHPQAEGICVDIRDRVSGETRQLLSKLAIFADGPVTLARKSLGIGFGVGRDKTAQAMVCEVEWNNNSFSDFEYFFDTKISPWGYGWICPKKGALNMGVGGLISAMLREKKKVNLRRRLDYFMSRHPVSSDRLKGRRVLSMKSALIPLALAKRIHSERSLVVGDSAGMVDPLWGGGIEYAMRGAVLAAKCAVEALEHERFDSEFLGRYEAMYRSSPDFRWLRRLSLTFRLGLLYSKLNRQALIPFYKLTLRRSGAYRLKD